MSQANALTLLYFHDPMCSWCWGFKPAWTQIQATLTKDIRIKQVTGGLAPDSDAPMPENMKAMLQNTWQRIAQTIPGTQFNYAFWQEASPRRSTYPACRAVVAARLLDKNSDKHTRQVAASGPEERTPEKPFIETTFPETTFSETAFSEQPSSEQSSLEQAMITGIQHAYYLEAKNPSDNDVLIDIAASLGVDRHTFEQMLFSDDVKAAFQQDLNLAAQTGAQGFPSLFLTNNVTQPVPIPVDYNHAQSVVDHINTVRSALSRHSQ